MIPPDVASRLRLITQDQPAPPQALLPTKQLTDVLTNLVPGQRLMAEIKMLLPNGTYRAVVSQRDVTLALPFAAKNGDSLELEVLESNGKLSLAVVTSKSPGNAGAGAQADSVPTRLSNTGQLIGTLLTGIDTEGKRAPPATLNNNQPIVEKMPQTASELVPVLKEALSKSGMFFESHQAQWVEGKVSTASLLEQPQGKLSPALPQEPGKPANPSASPASPQSSALPASSLASSVAPPNPEKSVPGMVEKDPAAAALSTRLAPEAAKQAHLPTELMPIVQQQLDALSTQNYLWQGQLTPGVEMQWEISEEEVHEREAEGEGDPEKRWTTRLQLTLPNLGGISATLSLRSDSELEISLNANAEAVERLRSDSGTLYAGLQAAGLTLNAFALSHGEPD